MYPAEGGRTVDFVSKTSAMGELSVRSCDAGCAIKLKNAREEELYIARVCLDSSSVPWLGTRIPANR